MRQPQWWLAVPAGFWGFRGCSAGSGGWGNLGNEWRIRNPGGRPSCGWCVEDEGVVVRSGLADWRAAKEDWEAAFRIGSWGANRNCMGGTKKIAAKNGVKCASSALSATCAVQINLDGRRGFPINSTRPGKAGNSGNRGWPCQIAELAGWAASEGMEASFHKGGNFTGFDGRLAATSVWHQRKLPHAGPSIRRRWFHEFQDGIYDG